MKICLKHVSFSSSLRSSWEGKRGLMIIVMEKSEIKLCLKQIREHIQEKEFKKGLRDCEKILTDDKTNYFALVFAGHCCVELNDALEARKFYDQAVRVDEKQALAWQGYGLYYEKFAVYDENYCNCLRKILELAGDETKRLENKLKLAKCMSKIGKSVEAFQEIKTLSSDKSNIDKISKVTDCYKNEVDCCDVALKKEKSLGYLRFLLSVDFEEDALDVAVDLLNNFHNDSEVICSFGDLLVGNFLTDLNLSERYLGELDRFIQKSASNKIDKSVFACLEYISEYLSGSIVNGLTILEELENHASYKYIRILLAVGYFNVGDYQKSLKLCDEVLLLNQESPDTILRLRLEFMKNESEFNFNRSNALKRDSFYDKYNQIIDLCAKRCPKLAFECVLGKTKCIFAAGKFDEANYMLEEYLNQDLDDHWRFEADLFRCSANIERGNVVEAGKFIERCLEFDDEHFLISILLGKIELIRRKQVASENENDKLAAEAKNHFRKALELNPRSWEAFYYMGLLQMERDASETKTTLDKQLSLRCMEYARQYNGYNIDIVRSLIILYDKYDTTDKKSTLLNEFLQDKIADPENADLFEQQADLMVKQNLVGDATSIFQKLIALFDANCNLLSKLAQCYRLRGSFSSALLCLEKCLKIEPNSLIINFQIAEVYFDLELFVESIQKCREILLKYGENFSPARLALGEALYHMTKFSFEKGLYVQSLDYCIEGLEMLLKIAEKTCIYHKLLGDFCTFLDNFSIKKLVILENSTLSRYCVISKLHILQLGSKFYVKACQMAPEETDFFHDLALNLLKCYIIEKSTETLQNSRKCIERAIVLNSKKSELWSLLGCIARYEEDCPDNKNFTQNCFVRALQIDERNAHAWTNLGLFYLETFPNVEIAHECFKKAQIADPKFCNAWIGQAIIAERVKSPQAPDLFRHTTSLANHPESLIGYACYALTASLNQQKVECTDFPYCIPSAQDAIIKFVELHSDDACALNSCGLLCELNGHDRLAIGFYEKYELDANIYIFNLLTIQLNSNNFAMNQPLSCLGIKVTFAILEDAKPASYNPYWACGTPQSRLMLENESAKNDDFDFTTCIDMVKENLLRLYRKLSKFNEASGILLGMKNSTNFPHMDAALINFESGKFEEALQNYDYSLYHTKSSDDSFYVTVAQCLCLVKIEDHEKALSFFVEKIGYVDERPHAKIVLLLIKSLSKRADFKLIKDCLSALMNSTNFSELTRAVLNYLSTVHQDTQACSWIMHKFPYLLQSRMVLLTNNEQANTVEYFNDVSPIVYSKQDAKTISNYLIKYATQKFISNFCHSNPDYRSLIK